MSTLRERIPVISKSSFRFRITASSTRILVDTDPGVDDIVALLLALASPELDILAIIVSYGKFRPLRNYNTNLWSLVDCSVVLGNTDIDASLSALTRYVNENPAYQNQFPNFSSIRKPILAKGSHGPLEDGLGGISERHPDLNVSPEIMSEDHPQLRLIDKSGVDVVLELLRSYPPRSITYIALGPLTNLAHTMKKDGGLFRANIGRVVCMGGALDVPGNTSPVAEFNFFADPYAVKELLLSLDPQSRLPLDRFLLLPLDITTPHELPFQVYTEAIDPSFDSTAVPSLPLGKSSLVHFTSSFLERTREIMLSFGKDAMELHDIVAIWCAIENPPGCELSPGWKTRSRIFDIERNGELTRGMLVVDRREDESAYSPGANRAKIQAELKKNNVPHGIWESSALPAQVETEEAAMKSRPPAGVVCVTETPGADVLLWFLFRRVWGVEMTA
ncbi:hypothetical protein C0995_016035 [Termitomyces sp. Mi166|nr:hypothetical protein C0995_016035 [Termitomyces sp. Mi166\